MASDPFAQHPGVVTSVAEALEGVPRAAYSVPHVYPNAAPAYEQAPNAVRAQPDSDHISLYVHLPYCRYKCTFCHFAVRVGADVSAMERYVRALQRELEWIVPGTPLSHLYVGGGTPTVLPAELMDEVLGTVFGRTTPFGSHMHTVETSPETISDAHLDVFRRRGIGRVSMGVQSLEGAVLEKVHRDQTAATALAACEMLVDSGLVVNVDLIYGLPDQTRESFLFDLETLADLGVPAVTLYSLRVNARTPIARVLGEEPFDLEHLMSWRAFVKHAAEELGYTQTRWHTFKRLDTIAEAQERQPYFDDRLAGFQLGAGMSARSNLGHTVYRNHEVHDVYIDRVERGESPVEQVFRFDEDDRMTQLVARSLGDGKALRRDVYERTFGRPVEDDFGPLLERLEGAELVDDDGTEIVLTDLGKLVYDLVTLAFYPESAKAWLGAREGTASFVTLGTPPAHPITVGG